MNDLVVRGATIDELAKLFALLPLLGDVTDFGLSHGSMG